MFELYLAFGLLIVFCAVSNFVIYRRGGKAVSEHVIMQIITHILLVGMYFVPSIIPEMLALWIVPAVMIFLGVNSVVIDLLWLKFRDRTRKPHRQ